MNLADRKNVKLMDIAPLFSEATLPRVPDRTECTITHPTVESEFRVQGGFIDLSFSMPAGIYSSSPGKSVRRGLDILKGKVREDLKRFVTGEKPMGRTPDGKIYVPVGGVSAPRFIHGDNGNRGASAGDGEPGDSLGRPGKPGKGQTGKGGDGPGEHELLIGMELEEFTKMLAEELELPRIEPKDSGNVHQERVKYNSRTRTQADGLRHVKATYKEALKRTIVEGAARGKPYMPGDPIIPERVDRWNKTGTPVLLPETQCDVVYIMDVSGSMDGETRAIAMQEAFWIEQFLCLQYPSVRRHFIAHDSTANLVTEDEFFRINTTGGTHISSGYELLVELFSRKGDNGIDTAMTNTYVFQFSDGDNMSSDNARAVQALRDKIVPYVNLFGYVEIDNGYGSGDFGRALRKAGIDDDTLENVVLSSVEDKREIWDSLKQLLGKGR